MKITKKQLKRIIREAVILQEAEEQLELPFGSNAPDVENMTDDEIKDMLDNMSFVEYRNLVKALPDDQYFRVEKIKHPPREMSPEDREWWDSAGQTFHNADAKVSARFKNIYGRGD